ncbi:MAG TPA: cation-transporting P-type ATPase [Thermoanaerobaculia bacterium]|nr:cation-transporting P-type ATPase [Thermoanaerobaculia bacterium]
MAEPRDPDAAGDASVAAWHSLPANEALEALGSSASGLDEPEARRRLAVHGPNRLTVTRARPWWRILLDQLRSLVVLLLGGAALAALILGEPHEGVAILIVLVLNTAIGFTMEWRARTAMEALRELDVEHASVLRAGALRTLPAGELVPGDVVAVEAGDAVPADARILEETELRVVEAPLTGESVPVVKSAEPVPGDADASLAERRSMLYKGTLVAAGTARALVVGTGRDTEIGRIGELVAAAEDEQTPLERRLAQLGGRLVWLTLGVAALVAGAGILRGRDVWLMVQTGVALAVAAIPEGLPVVVTITLALGMRRMARRRALVRRLPAVETLGSVTVICTDKTGTLTGGEMTLRRITIAGRRFEVTGEGYEPDGRLRPAATAGSGEETVGAEDEARVRRLLAVATLASRARLERGASGLRVIGDPTEAAVLVAAAKLGLSREALLEERPQVEEVPFSSERMLLASFHRRPDEPEGAAGALEALVKGAPRTVLELSSRVLGAAGEAPLGDEDRRWWLDENRRLARDGLRVLAVASRVLPGDADADLGALDELTFLGLVGILDPPAAGVPEALAALSSAGIRTLMITGDQTETARAIARELGMLEDAEGGAEADDGAVLEGRELRTLDDRALASRLATVRAFARTSPADKLRIVEALQARGEIVGMLGDGVNDAPALKRADIGVAMGRRGTAVAKETADLVLQDDRLETVAGAVEEGRVIFDNIRKFILYLFSCNLSEVLILFAGGASSLPLPILPLQILWLNLVTDVLPALALAVEPAEPGVMGRPPRDPGSALLSGRFLGLVGAYAGWITVSVLGVFLWALGRPEIDTRHAVTLTFMTLALAQLLHVFNARSVGSVLLPGSGPSNPWVWGAVVLTVGLQLAAVYLPPLAAILGTVPLGARDWAVVAIGSVAPLAIGQAWKLVRHRGAAAA